MWIHDRSCLHFPPFAYSIKLLWEFNYYNESPELRYGEK
jgi:hypothetical protein